MAEYIFVGKGGFVIQPSFLSSIFIFISSLYSLVLFVCLFFSEVKIFVVILYGHCLFKHRLSANWAKATGHFVANIIFFIGRGQRENNFVKVTFEMAIQKIMIDIYSNCNNNNNNMAPMSQQWQMLIGCFHLFQSQWKQNLFDHFF